MGRAALKTAENKPFVKVERGRKVLRVGGVIQSVSVDSSYFPDVWDAMLPDIQPAAALILGLGGGTVAALMTQRWGALPIIGVERDPAVAWLARHEFGLGELPHVQIVEADAFTYVRQSKERFDFICVDLYVAGKMAYGVLGGSFLRDIARMLTPNGTAAFNLWHSPYLPDQLRRLARALDVCTTIRVDENIIVSCGRRASHHMT
jgi:spermidine synthase